MMMRRSLPTIAAPDRSAMPIACWHYRDFPLHRLVDAKGDQTVSVCIPAHDEGDTVGRVVSKVRRHLVDRLGLVDEVLVVDDHSSDDTAKVAEAAGARGGEAPAVLAEGGGGG